MLGNQGNADSVEALTRGLVDSEPIVRGASAWALGRIQSDQAVRVLMARAKIESDGSVVEEITAALATQQRGDESAVTE